MKKQDSGAWYTIKIRPDSCTVNVWVCRRHLHKAPGVFVKDGLRGTAQEPCVVCEPESGYGPEIGE